MAADDGNVVRMRNHIAVEAIGKCLVGGRGIVEAVADARAPCGERRPDDLVRQLGSGRLLQQQLANVAHLAVLRVEQNRANLLRNLDATRFTQPQNVVARKLKRAGEQHSLR